MLAEETVPKLTSEREQLQSTVDRLTSQLDNTESRLQEERAARKKLEENQEARIKEVESSWSAVLTEKTNNWSAKEKSLEEKVENQERLLKEVKASYEVSQRLDQGDSGDGSRNGATAAELELVSADLEKANLRLTEVEARNEQMRLELAQAVSHSHPENATSVEDDPAYLRLQSENSSLLRKLDAARFDRESERHSWESKVSQSERQSSKVLAEKEELRSKLEKMADYEDVRRELEMIKVWRQTVVVPFVLSRLLTATKSRSSSLSETMMQILKMTPLKPPLMAHQSKKIIIRRTAWSSFCWPGIRN